MHVVNSLVPVFLVVALGWLLNATKFLSPEFFRGMNRLTYWVGLPAFLFYKIAAANFEGGEAMRLFYVLTIGDGAVILVALVLGLILKMPKRSRGAMVHASFRANLGYVGLPVVYYVFSGSHGEQVDRIMQIGIIAIAPLIPLINIAAVVVLLLHRESCGEKTDRITLIRNIAVNILTNPLLIACAAGLVVCLSGLKLPVATMKTCTAVGQMAMPLALLSIGASLTLSSIRGNIGYSVLTAVLRVAVCPLLTYFAARMLDLSPESTLTALIYMACPTAVASYVVTEQLGGDETLAGNVVIISTLLSAVSLSAVILLMGA